MKNHIVSVFFFFASALALGQHKTDHKVTNVDDLGSHKFVNDLALLYGSILVPEYNEHDEKIGSIVVPSFSIDYELWLHHKYGLLVMNEFFLSNYELRGPNGESIKRESVLITAIAFGYSPFKHSDVFIGGGYEIDLKNGNSFAVFRTGTEYVIPIRNNWGSVLALAIDFRKQYISTSFEIGFAKFF